MERGFSPPVSPLARALYGAALIATTASAVAFTAIAVLRSGLGDSSPQQAMVVLLFAVLPFSLSAWAARRHAENPLRLACALGASTVFSVVWPVAGLFLGRYAAIPAGLALAFAVLAGRGHLRATLRLPGHAAAGWGLAVAALALLFSPPARLFLPEFLTIGLAHADSYFHTAIAQMIANFGAVATGGDGFVHHNYHFLSHAIAAGLSRASGAPVPTIYLYWGTIALQLQVAWSLFLATVFFAPTRATPGRNGVGFRLAYAWLAAAVLGFASESFMLGVALIAATLPLLVTLMHADPSADRRTLAALGLAVVLVFLSAAAKVSTGFFGAVGLVLVMVHFQQHRAVAAAIAVSLAGVALFTHAWLSPGDTLFTRSDTMTLVRSYMQYVTLLTLISYALPAIVIAIFMWRPRAQLTAADRNLSLRVVAIRPALPAASQPSRALLDKIRQGLGWARTLDAIPRFLVASLLACVAVLLTVPIGSNVAYFSLVLLALAFAFLPAALQVVIGVDAVGSWARRVIVLALALAALNAATAFVAGTVTVLGEFQQAVIRESAADPPRFRAMVATSLRTHGTLFGELDGRLRLSHWSRFTHELQQQALAHDWNLAVHVSPSATEVWRRLEERSPYWCMVPHLMIPAELGLVQIRSMAPESIERECAPPGVVWYGFGQNQAAHRTGSLSDEALCSAARRIGMRAVYRVRSYTDTSLNSVIPCAELSAAPR